MDGTRGSRLVGVGFGALMSASQEMETRARSLGGPSSDSLPIFRFIKTRHMVSISTFRQMALSLPDAVELPHFDRPSFRVKGKIFATLWEKENRAMLKLSPIDQSVFCSYDETIFFPVPGGWGAKGATLVELSKVKKALLQDALNVAYEGVTVKKRK